MGKVKKKSKADLAYEKIKNSKITEEWNKVKAAKVWHEEPKEEPDVKKGENADFDQIKAAQDWTVKMRKIEFKRAKSVAELASILDMLEFRVDASNPHYKKMEKYLE